MNHLKEQNICWKKRKKDNDQKKEFRELPKPEPKPITRCVEPLATMADCMFYQDDQVNYMNDEIYGSCDMFAERDDY